MLQHATFLFVVFTTNNRIIKLAPKLNSIFSWQRQRRKSERITLLIVVCILNGHPQNPYNYSAVRQRQRDKRVTASIFIN
jgi:hypothetical protein